MTTVLAGRDRLAAVRLPAVPYGARLPVAVAVTAALLAVVAATAATGWDSSEPWFAAGLRVVGVGSVAGVGLWATARRPQNRFGPVMVGVGLLYGVTMLNGSGSSLVYSIGRTMLPFAELALAYLILAFPSGRLVEARDRRLLTWLAVLTPLLWVPAVLLGPRFTVGGPTVACDSRCPDNAFLVTDRAAVARALSDGVYIAFMVTMVLVVWSLYRRYTASPPVLRRSLSAVTVSTGTRAVVLVVYAALALTVPHSVAASIFSWLIFAATVAIPLAFVVGTIRARLLWIPVLETLLRDLARALDPDAFRRTLAAAVGDPSLQLVHVGDAGELTDRAGEPVRRPAPDGRTVVTGIDAGLGGLALLHDRTLLQDPEFLDAVVGATAIELAQYRRRRQVDELVDDLRSSRSRLAAARDEERRRMERDLHDGAQQELVAVKLRLAVVESMLETDPAAATRLLADVGHDLGSAIGQIRLLAHGIYPPLLEGDGPVAAVRAAAERSALPTRVEADGVPRAPRDVETAVYFCCLEAMQNADKHAGDGARVTVRLWHDGGLLRFSATDDGVGFDPAAAAPGAGLVNMRDRLESVGGGLEVTSAPSGGTRIEGYAPAA